jgi:ketosteroid isomerase-like protein
MRRIESTSGDLMTERVQIFHAFLDAIEAGDPDRALSLCTDDITFWHNTTLIEEPADSLTATINWLHGNFTEVHYERGIVRDGNDSVTAEVVLCATAPDGDIVRTPTCVIADYRDGAIFRERVYLSTSHSLRNKVPR